jgi:hypothetical protein
MFRDMSARCFIYLSSDVIAVALAGGTIAA